jgi:hypothetical protein
LGKYSSTAVSKDYSAFTFRDKQSKVRIDPEDEGNKLLKNMIPIHQLT